MTSATVTPPAPGNNGHAAAAAVEQSAETLLTSCSKLRVSYSWPGTSAKIDDDVLEAMLGGGHRHSRVIKDAMSSSKRLLKSEHPAYQAAKQAMQAVKDYVLSMTVPAIALRSSGDCEADLRKDAGVRLIQKKDMAQFDERLRYLVGVLGTAAQRLHEAMPAIKAEDKERLDRLNARLYKEADYPQDVRKEIGVSYAYEAVGIDADWAQLCPEIYRREQEAGRRRFAGIVENAAAGFADSFVKLIRQVTEQCGQRVRLRPVKGRATVTALVVDADGKDRAVEVSAVDAEVLEVVRHAADPEVPEGHVLLRLRLHKEGKGKSPEVWLAHSLSEADYLGKLCPYTSDERKRISTSTIENLKQEMETFLNIGAMLGPYQEVIGGAVAEVKGLLQKASLHLSSDDIAKQLRSGDYFRAQVREALEGVANKVRDAVETVKPRRRSVIHRPAAEEVVRP